MNDLIARLGKIIEAGRISTEPARLDELSWDALSEGRIHPRREPVVISPLCAVTPTSTSEVQQIVRFANAERVAIVPFGGGSGLMGGALSIRPSIVLDLRRMDRILEVDAEAGFARAEAGVVLEALDRQLNRSGYILGHDPWTVPVATLGGAISTNSVGYRAGVYGSMGDQVLGLEAVLPNGELFRTRAVAKHSAGIHLNALLIGGEGCFGVITEATIRVFPKPEAQLLSGYGFSSFESGYRAIQKIFAQRLRPAMLDFGDDAEKPPHGAVLYLLFEGNQALAKAEEKLASAILRTVDAAALPRSDAEHFWRNRHETARRFASNRRQRRERGRDGVYRDWIHVALPSSKVLPFRRAAQELVESHGVRLQESGLWVSPELFSMRLGIEEGSVADARLALEEAVDGLLRMVQKIGGSMEYTHGVGVKLAPLMRDEHGYGFEVMRQIKQALDPNNIMNPGKMGL